jgi:hypothetical protein
MILEWTIAVNLITSGMTRDDKYVLKFCKTLLLLFEKYQHMNMKNNDNLKRTNM